MVEEFDDVFEDDITTLTFTYADDVEIPEIPDTEGIHVVEITNNRLVIKHILDDDEVYDYIKSCGLTSRPIKLSIEFCVYEDSEEEQYLIEWGEYRIQLIVNSLFIQEKPYNH